MSGPGWPGANQAFRPADHETAGRLLEAKLGDASEIHIEAAAVRAYRASLNTGRPLSERKLAAMFGKTSRRWARHRMTGAREASGPEAPSARQPAQPRRERRSRLSGAGVSLP
jgi:hypothetical protein